MQRRTLLKVGAGSAFVVGAVTAGLAWIEVGMRDGRLTQAGRDVFAGVARAVLEGMLPSEPHALDAALGRHLNRLDGLIAQLPPATRDELGQLTTLLASPPGRIAFAGLTSPWAEAGADEIGQALQRMRRSTFELRQQAYHALRDLTNGAYFADPKTWAVLGYPGPMQI
jgi:hypothetical protein